jgi:hypothetical protein
MPFIGVLCLVLLLFAALGSTLWWRGPAGTVWYTPALFYWGLFLFALYMIWPGLKSLV